MAGASRIWKFVKSNLPREYDVDLLGLAFDFFTIFHNKLRASCGRPHAVCSATFRRDLLLQLLNPYHIISAVTALQAPAQLEVACLFFFMSCVMSIYLSIDLFCLFFRLAWCCWLRLLYRCYTSSRHVIT